MQKSYVLASQPQSYPLQKSTLIPSYAPVISKPVQVPSPSIIQLPKGVQSVIAEPQPSPSIYIENIAVQKYYIDYEPVISHQHVAYEREYEEQHTTSLGINVPVMKTMTDYQTVQFTNFNEIQVPYTDYKQIEHRTEYVPRVRYEIITECIPLSQLENIVEQHPYQGIKTQENGSQIQTIENVQQLKSVQKNETITQQRVQQVIEYEEVKQSRVLNESTVQMPIVQEPQPSQVVVQQSIHEPQLNVPEQVVQNNLRSTLESPTHLNSQPQVQNLVQVSQYPYQNQQPQVIQLVPSYSPNGRVEVTPLKQSLNQNGIKQLY